MCIFFLSLNITLILACLDIRLVHISELYKHGDQRYQTIFTHTQIDQDSYVIFLFVGPCEESFCPVPVEIGAASDCVVSKVLLGLLVAKVFQGVGPQQVAHGPKRRGLLEPVQLGHTKNTHRDTETQIVTHRNK